MNHRITFAAGLSLACAAALHAAPKRAAAAEALVPANMQPMTDDKGNQWSLNNYGFLQNTGNSFFNNILMLHVNGQQFYNYQPLMTPDGKEFVLPGQQPVMGLQITRRVRLLEKDGVMRYLDLFHQSRHLHRHRHRRIPEQLFQPGQGDHHRSRGAQPGTLAKGETGVLVTSKQQGQKAVLFTLGAPRAN